MIHVNFNATLHFESLPMIEMYLTSESNSNGVIFKEWMDGHELGFEFEKVTSKLSSSKQFKKNCLISFHRTFGPRKTFGLSLKQSNFNT